MELLLVIVVVLIVGFYIKNKRKDDPSPGAFQSPDFEESGMYYDNFGLRDLNIMQGDGKGGLRDVGDIGL